jgi:hypothetical protein
LNQNVSAGYQVMKLFTQPHKIGVHNKWVVLWAKLSRQSGACRPHTGKRGPIRELFCSPEFPRNSAFSILHMDHGLFTPCSSDPSLACCGARARAEH